MIQPKPLRPRGSTLIEGLISTTVLIIGIVGAFQGIVQASTQNTVAGRLARATAMAAQVRLSLERQTLKKMTTGTGLLTATYCAAPSAGLNPLTDNLYNLSDPNIASICLVDLDVADPLLAAADKIVPRYDLAADATNGSFRRVLVYMKAAAPADASLPRNPDVVGVVISVKEGAGRRVFVKQFASFFDPTPGVAAPGVEL
jgi:hypothetical protein